MTTPTWTYGGDPTDSDLDEVRLLIGDTDPTTPLLYDQAIQYLITKIQNIYGVPDRTVTPTDTSSNIMVAAYAADLISRQYAGLARVQADGVNVDLSAISEAYANMATSLRTEYERQQDTDSEGVNAESDLLLACLTDDWTIRPLTWGIGMDDNPWAGRQDFAHSGGFWWWDPNTLVGNAEW